MYETIIQLTPTTSARMGLVALEPDGPYRLTVDHPATRLVEYFTSSRRAIGRWKEIEAQLRQTGKNPVTLGVMAAAGKERRGSDRRRQGRGGRRSEDPPGYAPLVLVIDGKVGRRDITEAILVRLRFAVAPVDSADKALALMETIRPEIIVSPEVDAPRLRRAALSNKAGAPIPVVAVEDGNRDPDVFIESIRVGLRAPE
jgi:hypothetical protein